MSGIPYEDPAGAKTDAAPAPPLGRDHIGRSLLLTTVHVRHVVEPGRLSSGTAFFYNAYRGGVAGKVIPMLVTNKHVVRGAANGTLRLLRGDDEGIPLLGQAIEIPFSERDWVGHPSDDVDVAVTLMGPTLSQLIAQNQRTAWKAVGPELLPSNEAREDLDVGETITLIGYPSGLYDTANLTPILRRGVIATPVQLDYCGKPQFLVDASIFPGSSGSPVFVLNDTGYRQGRDLHIGARLIFLGIVAAVHKQVGTGRLVTKQTPDVEFDHLIDLGLVFKWNTIEEAIGEFFRRRNLDPFLRDS